MQRKMCKDFGILEFGNRKFDHLPPTSSLGNCVVSLCRLSSSANGLIHYPPIQQLVKYLHITKNHSSGGSKPNSDPDLKMSGQSEGRKEHRTKNKDKDKFNMLVTDDDIKLRKERKLGRKRDRAEEALLLAEKRRKEEEKGKMSHQNGDPDEMHHREKHHHTREKSPYIRERERVHEKPYVSKKQYYDYNDRYYD